MSDVVQKCLYSHGVITFANFDIVLGYSEPTKLGATAA